MNFRKNLLFTTTKKLFSLFLTYVAIAQALYLCPKLITTFTRFKLKVFLYFSFGLTAFMTIWCHTVCVFKTPGFLNSSDFSDESKCVFDDNIPFCKKCNVFKIKRAHHCSICQKCIIKMDHHCTWVNNCIGFYNQKHFILFNLYTVLLSLNCVFIITYKLFSCIQRDEHLRRILCNFSKKDVILIITNSVGCIIFGSFTFVMLIDQYYGIKTNTTGIEFLKGQKGEKKSFEESLKEIFGRRFSYLWFFPVDAHIQH